MPKYLVTVLLENKKEIDDPEGQTIYRDLILRGGYNFVLSVQSAKCLKFLIHAGSKTEAGDQISKMCYDLRIYNPIVNDFRTERIQIVR